MAGMAPDEPGSDGGLAPPPGQVLGRGPQIGHGPGVEAGTAVVVANDHRHVPAVAPFDQPPAVEAQDFADVGRRVPDARQALDQVGVEVGRGLGPQVGDRRGR